MAVLSFIIDYLIQLLGTGTVHVQYCVCMNVPAVLIILYSKCTVYKARTTNGIWLRENGS